MLNASTFPKKYEASKMPSETVPDQTMSIREILTRYARGLPLAGERVPVYSDDPENDLPDLQHLDLAERQEILEERKEELEDIKRRVAERKKSKTKKAPEGSAEARADNTGEGKPPKEATQERTEAAKQPD